MKFTPLVISLLLTLLSCQNDMKSPADIDTSTIEETIRSESEKSQSELQEVESPEQIQQVTLEAFSEFPPEIDGCSCYFSGNKEAFKQGNYLFMSNFDKLAFIKIDDELIRFELLEEKDEPYNTIWQDEKGRIMVLETVEMGQMDETWQYEGVLTLMKDNTPIYKRTIIGECGC